MKSLAIDVVVYAMLTDLSKEMRIKPSLYVEKMIKNAYEKKNP